MTMLLQTTTACSQVHALTPRTRVLLQKLGVPICKDATNCPLRNLSLVYTPLTAPYRYSCLSTTLQAIYYSILQSSWVIFLLLLIRKNTCYKSRTGHWSSRNAFSCSLQSFQANVAKVTEQARVISFRIRHSSLFISHPIIRRYSTVFLQTVCLFVVCFRGVTTHCGCIFTVR
jgi:hypothetical protein